MINTANLVELFLDFLKKTWVPLLLLFSPIVKKADTVYRKNNIKQPTP